MSELGIQGLGGLGTLKDLGDLADLDNEIAPSKGPSKERISLPREVGRRRDPLEAAAMQGVVGTLPERIVWKWLETRGHLYEAQQSVMGGRLLAGGAVVDFLVYDMSSQSVAIRVMGDYWHGPAFPGRQARDDAQAARLRERGYLVVDLWESKIYEAVEFDRLTAFVEETVFGG